MPASEAFRLVHKPHLLPTHVLPFVPSPLFSIVTVCLNPGELLLRTVRSVLNQKLANFVYIVKDGGSTDGATAGLPPDTRLRVLAKADEGIFDAMNQALELCPSGYVLFLNAGDVLCGPQSLEKVASAARQTQMPEVVYTYYEYGQAGNVIKYPSRLTSSYLYRRSVCHQATFIRRDCYARYGALDSSFRIGADDEFLARLILKERVRQSLGPFPTVRIEEWNFSSSPESRAEELRAREFIRQHYLTPREQLRGRLLYAATLPDVRKAWLSMPRTSRWYRFYITLSNFVNERL